MKKVLLLCALLGVFILNGYGQEQEDGMKEFKLTGKPIVTLFADYSAGLGHANEQSGFDLGRCYLGYKFSVLNDLGGIVIFDVGSTKVKGADYERVAFLKNAMLSWTPGKFTFNFGLTSTEQFNLQEKFWGYRYIWKSFQDEYKFNASADLGITAAYKFNDRVSADLSFFNGEGYKKLNMDNKYRYGVGVTLTPVKPLVLRAYYDRYDGKEEGAKTQQSMALFAGYKHKWFSVGVELNKLWAAGFVDKQDRTGYSAFASVYMNKKFTLFGRYDDLISKDHYFSGDQRRAVVGLQYEPLRYLRISPNFQTVNPSAGRASSSLFLSVEFKL